MMPVSPTARGLGLAFVLGATLLAASAAEARDEFERHTGELLAKHLEEADAVESLSMDQAARLKPLSATVTTPCVAIRTGEGNIVKALVTWGFRKTEDKPVPVLLIERFVTYRGDILNQTVANGQDVMVFSGFAFDFDIGQVVPEDLGGDLRVGQDGTIQVDSRATLAPLSGTLLPREPATARPEDREGVQAADFAGVWQVNADGRWTGTWELVVDERGQISGTYVSDDSRSRYDISGRSAAQPHNAHLEIFLANAQQSVDAYLWTTDKSTMAGTVTLAGRSFGFYAVRESPPENADGD